MNLSKRQIDKVNKRIEEANKQNINLDDKEQERNISIIKNTNGL